MLLLFSPLKRSVGKFFEESFFPIAALWAVMFLIYKGLAYRNFFIFNESLMLKLLPSAAEAFADSSALVLMTLAGCLIIVSLFLIRNIWKLNLEAKTFHHKYSLRILDELSAALVQIGCGIALSAYVVNQPSILVENKLLHSSLQSFLAGLVIYCASDILKRSWFRMSDFLE